MQGQVPFTRSSQTRANNSSLNAQRATMVGNQTAQQSIRNQTSKTSAPKPGAVSQPAMPVGPPVDIPTGPPQTPVEETQNFDPSVFVDQAIGQFVGQVKLKNFIESPRVKDAMESIRLKNIMNSDNPNYQKDQRSLFQQIVSKIGMSNG